MTLVCEHACNASGLRIYHEENNGSDTQKTICEVTDFTSWCFQTATLRSRYVFGNVSVSRLGLEAVSRRFLERLSLASRSQDGLETFFGMSRLGLEGSTTRSRLGLGSLKKWNVSVLTVDRLGLAT